MELNEDIERGHDPLLEQNQDLQEQDGAGRDQALPRRDEPALPRREEPVLPVTIEFGNSDRPRHLQDLLKFVREQQIPYKITYTPHPGEERLLREKPRDEPGVLESDPEKEKFPLFVTPQEVLPATIQGSAGWHMRLKKACESVHEKEIRYVIKDNHGSELREKPREPGVLKKNPQEKAAFPLFLIALSKTVPFGGDWHERLQEVAKEMRQKDIPYKITDKNGLELRERKRSSEARELEIPELPGPLQLSVQALPAAIQFASDWQRRLQEVLERQRIPYVITNKQGEELVEAEKNGESGRGVLKNDPKKEDFPLFVTVPLYETKEFPWNSDWKEALRTAAASARKRNIRYEIIRKDGSRLPEEKGELKSDPAEGQFPLYITEFLRTVEQSDGDWSLRLKKVVEEAHEGQIPYEITDKHGCRLRESIRDQPGVLKNVPDKEQFPLFVRERLRVSIPFDNDDGGHWSHWSLRLRVAKLLANRRDIPYEITDKDGNKLEDEDLTTNRSADVFPIYVTSLLPIPCPIQFVDNNSRLHWSDRLKAAVNFALHKHRPSKEQKEHQPTGDEFQPPPPPRNEQLQYEIKNAKQEVLLERDGEPGVLQEVPHGKDFPLYVSVRSKIVLRKEEKDPSKAAFLYFCSTCKSYAWAKPTNENCCGKHVERIALSKPIELENQVLPLRFKGAPRHDPCNDVYTTTIYNFRGEPVFLPPDMFEQLAKEPGQKEKTYWETFKELLMQNDQEPENHYVGQQDSENQSGSQDRENLGANQHGFLCGGQHHFAGHGLYLHVDKDRQCKLWTKEKPISEDVERKTVYVEFFTLSTHLWTVFRALVTAMIHSVDVFYTIITFVQTTCLKGTLLAAFVSLYLLSWFVASVCARKEMKEHFSLKTKRHEQQGQKAIDYEKNELCIVPKEVNQNGQEKWIETYDWHYRKMLLALTITFVLMTPRTLVELVLHLHCRGDHPGKGACKFLGARVLFATWMSKEHFEVVKRRGFEYMVPMLFISKFIVFCIQLKIWKMTGRGLTQLLVKVFTLITLLWNLGELMIFRQKLFRTAADRWFFHVKDVLEATVRESGRDDPITKEHYQSVIIPKKIFQEPGESYRDYKTRINVMLRGNGTGIKLKEWQSVFPPFLIKLWIHVFQKHFPHCLGKPFRFRTCKTTRFCNMHWPLPKFDAADITTEIDIRRCKCRRRDSEERRCRIRINCGWVVLSLAGIILLAGIAWDRFCLFEKHCAKCQPNDIPPSCSQLDL